MEPAIRLFKDWGGLKLREVDNQDRVGIWWERSSRGYWLEWPPRGVFSVLHSISPLSVLGLWVSPGPWGTKTAELESLQGPFWHQARGGGSPLNLGWTNRQMDRIKDKWESWKVFVFSHQWEGHLSIQFILSPCVVLTVSFYTRKYWADSFLPLRPFQTEEDFGEKSWWRTKGWML